MRPRRRGRGHQGGLRCAALVLAALVLLVGCGRNMADQPRLGPAQASRFFEGGSGNLPLPEGTVSRQRGGVDPVFFTGQTETGLATELPIELTLGLVQRGQERYDIYCSMCHGYTGDGDGMIVRRGFPRPASFHDERLLAASVGYYFSAMTNGFGRMYSYAGRIPPEDRWAIAAYVRALQLSQNATIDDVPADVRRVLELGTSQGRAPR
jgi:mono/diheme cytochrome c family protein